MGRIHGLSLVNHLYCTQLSVDLPSASISPKALHLPEGSWSALHLQRFMRTPGLSPPLYGLHKCSSELQ